VHQRLQRLKELEEIDFDDVAASGLTKRELLGLRRERDKLERTLGGIRFMSKVPSAVWIVDTNKEHIAVDEAKKLNIPIVAILDTNCDPDVVDYPIPGNDDAIRSVGLLTRIIADAVAEGKMAQAGATDEGAEDMPEWERELLEQQAAETAASPATTGDEQAVTEDVPAADAATTGDEQAVTEDVPAAEAATTEPEAPAAEPAAPEATPDQTSEENN
jgi:small subunit ribosomal protein S2